METRHQIEPVLGTSARKVKPSLTPEAEFSPFSADSTAELLRQYVEFKKQRNSRWSARAWGLRIGFKSPSALFNILKGRRLPDRPILNQMIKSMGLCMKGEDYVRCLFERDLRSRDAAPADTNLEARIRFLRIYDTAIELKGSDLNYVGSLLSHLITSLVSTEGFQEDPNWIQSRIRLTTTELEIRTTIQALLYVGLLRRDPNGNLVAANPFFEMPELVSASKTRKCFEESLELAQSSIHALPASERFLNTQIFHVRSDRYEEATAYIKNFRQEFTALFSEEKGSGADSVFQLNLQLIPLTKRKQP